MLDDDDGNVLAQGVEHAEQFEDDGRRHPSLLLNGSSSSSSFTLPDMARATATICCSPPPER